MWLGLLLLGCPDDDLPPRNCAVRSSYWPDPDGDGVGSRDAVYVGCEPPPGWVATPEPADSGWAPLPDHTGSPATGGTGARSHTAATSGHTGAPGHTAAPTGDTGGPGHTGATTGHTGATTGHTGATTGHTGATATTGGTGR